MASNNHVQRRSLRGRTPLLATLALLITLLLTLTAPRLAMASPAMLDFETIATASHIPDNTAYRGFLLSGFGAGPFGIGVSQAIYLNPVSTNIIKRADGREFIFTSVYIVQGGAASITTFQGYRDGAVVVTQNLNINYLSPVQVVFNWSNIDEIRISSTQQHIFDNMTVEVPTLAVTGNGQPIADGSATSDVSNHTNFGTVELGRSRTYTFTINNIGLNTLNLSGDPRVSITGAAAGDFTITQAPAASVATGGSTTFNVRFTPSTTRLRSATISIVSDDGTANPYDFVIEGTGLIRVWLPLLGTRAPIP